VQHVQAGTQVSLHLVTQCNQHMRIIAAFKAANNGTHKVRSVRGQERASQQERLVISVLITLKQRPILADYGTSIQSMAVQPELALTWRFTEMYSAWQMCLKRLQMRSTCTRRCSTVVSAVQFGTRGATHYMPSLMKLAIKHVLVMRLGHITMCRVGCAPTNTSVEWLQTLLGMVTCGSITAYEEGAHSDLTDSYRLG